MYNNFLKTDEAKQIFVLDYYGYKIVEKQADLTIPQELFILLGKPKFDERLQKESEKKYGV